MESFCGVPEVTDRLGPTKRRGCNSLQRRKLASTGAELCACATLTLALTTVCNADAGPGGV